VAVHGGGGADLGSLKATNKSTGRRICGRSEGECKHDSGETPPCANLLVSDTRPNRSVVIQCPKSRNCSDALAGSFKIIVASIQPISTDA
jgi:hypothetical protein